MSTVPAALGAGVAPGGDSNVRLSETAEAPRLTDALRAHPEAGSGALLAAQAHGPLPDRLDRALGQLVAAHADAAASPSIDANRDLTDTLREVRATLTEAPLPDRRAPTAAPGDRPLSDDRPGEEAPPLAESLLTLYQALGLDGETLDALEPLAHQRADQLPEPFHEPLADLLTAQARYQATALDAVRALGPSEDRAAREAAKLADASHALRHQVAETEDAIASLAQTHGPEEPWTGPLGLIVVGTPGEDRFDRDLDGNATATSAVQPAERQAREALAGTGAQASRELSADGASTRGQAGAQASDGGEARTGSGWHLLVLDPGGDDTYQDNAGGVSAGLTLDVQAGADGPVRTVRDPLVQDGRICAPGTDTCEPFGAGVFLDALGHVAASVQARGGLAAPMAALVVDAGGDDTYQDTGEAVQGAARGLATGLLVDRAGDDRYEADRLAQGASSLYGQGLLVDRGGDDAYEVDEAGQGYADLPDPAVVPEEAGPFEGEDLTTYLARHAAGGLRDLGGADAYILDDLRAGQGVQVLDQDYLEPLRSQRPYADLVDVGGEERLDAPTRTGGLTEEPVRPVYVNASGEPVAQAWIQRPLFEPGEGPPPAADRAYKTALAADTSPASPIQTYGLEVDGVSADCPADAGPALALACALTPDDAPGVLVGSPDRVEDPPPLTIALTGNTTYAGDVATSDADQAPEALQGSIEFRGGSVEAQVGPAAPPVPSLLVDVLGHDRYVGDDATIGYAADGGTALLVDVRGDDSMDAGNRSIAHAVGPGSTAAVWDLDGDLEASSGLRSQAYARSTGPATDRLDDDRRARAWIELGSPAADAGQAELRAGNHSQAYAVGTAQAGLNGTRGDDTYRVDGWGQGVHELAPEVANACQLEAPETPLFGGGISTFVVEELRPTHAYLGGTGTFQDPAGDDVYTVTGNAGLGDAWTRPVPCQGDQRLFAFTGQTNVHVQGLGLFLDRSGDDAYQLGVDRPRPAEASNRSCEPAAEDECEPADDTAWVTVDESQAAGTVFGQFNGPGALGYGVDGVSSVQKLPAATCRAFHTYTDDTRGFFGLIGEELRKTNCEELVLDRLESSPTATGAPAGAASALDDPARPVAFGPSDALLDASLPTTDSHDTALTPRGDAR